ncbi:thioredoxin, putative [Eimeria maxima]|uniref:protein disulfide-isomerase n=1 Tax=Eimeria maxima TaxID=5804 RepID=U6LX41_EIMMA|nr:thioredoxin, putative [Eimeria maxima]CDJ56301.1 thioredoxin, putative [Eimeria maxima]
MYTPAEAGLYSSNGAVKVLNAAEFKSQVINSHDLHLVEFYADWCGHCQRFAPEYEKVANALRGLATVVAVNDESIMKDFGVTGFPTVMVVVGRGGNKPKTFKYEGSRDANAVLDFVVTHIGKLARARLAGKIESGTGKSSGSKTNGSKSSSSSSSSSSKPKSSGPSDVIELKDTNFEKLVMQDEDNVWFVEFYAPWCGHCKALAPIWEEVATQLKGKVKVAKVDSTTEQMLATKFEIQAFPTLKLFPVGPKSTSVVKEYEGPRTADEIVKFAMEFYGAKAEAEQLLSEEQFRSECGETLCILAFLPDILDSQEEGRKNYLQTLNQVVKASITVPVKFLWLQGGDNFDLEEQLHLAFGWPAVVAVHLARGKFSVHRGNFTRESINSFLHQLLAGRAPVSDLPKLKTLKTAKKWVDAAYGPAARYTDHREFGCAD